MILILEKSDRLRAELKALDPEIRESLSVSAHPTAEKLVVLRSSSFAADRVVSELGSSHGEVKWFRGKYVRERTQLQLPFSTNRP